ncbi:MAG: putative sugar nucleotidyl transferase [Planctomycetaceae bacterium]
MACRTHSINRQNQPLPSECLPAFAGELTPTDTGLGIVCSSRGTQLPVCPHPDHNVEDVPVSEFPVSAMLRLLFEDQHAGQLSPIALARPVFELVCGRECLRRRVQRWFPGADWGAIVRPWLAESWSEEHPEASVNDFQGMGSTEVLLINGRWMPDRRPEPEQMRSDTAGFVDGHLAWIVLDVQEAALLSDLDFEQTLLGIARSRRAITADGIMIGRPWDPVSRNPRQLRLDFEESGQSQPPEDPHVQCLGNPADLYVSRQAIIDPYVVIDVRTGPVSIDQDVHIQSFTRIEGPCHIGRGSRLFRALIHRGTTIGPDCRVGGEVEESILHSHVNKYHEGFLGHSYVCPWVNLGAMTTTSDLKSDYSSVRVPLQGELINSELTKVGSFIGDHTKTAIDSMFNTGSSIGVMTLVLPGGRLLPRHIPSFCNVSFGELSVDWPLEQNLQTAAIAMSRRNCRLTPALERLFRCLYLRTEEERVTALNHASQRRIHRT